jgi:type VI secretion system FHA domain protein
MAHHELMRLRVVARPDGIEPFGDGQTIVAAGIKVGRAPECDLVLDDLLRLVSRQHAWLGPQGPDTALLRCISASAMLHVNGEPLAPGGERQVRDGDRIRIGGFEMRVERVVIAQPVSSLAAERAPPAAAPRTPPAAEPHSPRLDRWFDLATVADPLGPDSPLPSLSGLAASDSSRRLPPPEAPRANVLAFDASLTRVVQRGAEAMPSPRQTIAAPALPPADVVWPAAAEPLLPTRPNADAAPMSSALPAALRQAFLRGARLGDDVQFSVDAAWMEHLGALLHASTEGTLVLLRDRRLAKRSVRAENTQIVARQNNPLKFAPDVARALALLVRRENQPGFLDPIEAVCDAQRDLQLHQLAMVAGMRAAVVDLISRLGPESTESAEGPARGLAQSIPALRDAALWRRHLRDHEHMLQNLDDVFEAAFGREFLKAYEAQSKGGMAAVPPPYA